MPLVPKHQILPECITHQHKQGQQQQSSFESHKTYLGYRQSGSKQDTSVTRRRKGVIVTSSSDGGSDKGRLFD